MQCGDQFGKQFGLTVGGFHSVGYMCNGVIFCITGRLGGAGVLAIGGLRLKHRVHGSSFQKMSSSRFGQGRHRGAPTVFSHGIVTKSPVEPDLRSIAIVSTAAVAPEVPVAVPRPLPCWRLPMRRYLISSRP